MFDAREPIQNGGLVGRRSKKRYKLTPEQLAALIRSARESVGIIQSELAERVGVSKGAMSGYEKGWKTVEGRKVPVKPSLETFLNICDELNWSPDEVLRITPLPLGELERAIEASLGIDALSWFQGLDSRQLKELYELARAKPRLRLVPKPRRKR